MPISQHTEADATASDKTLAERALRLLRDDILGGQLAPDTKLRLNALQDRYGLGLSPLREALLRLSSEGMVKVEGQRGFAVAAVSLAELQDLTRARICLEASALNEAMAHGDAEWEAQIIAAYHRLSRAPLPSDSADLEAARLWEERHREFHHSLVAGCGSDWLLRLHSQLVDHSERYRKLRLLRHRDKAAQVRDVNAEHAAIMKAVLARQVDKAAALMKKHLNATAQAMARFLEPTPARAAPRARKAKAVR